MATNFDRYTHQQMREMIASLDPETVRTRATQLQAAADAIKKIADKLKTHVVSDWEGEGAVAFQEWVGRTGNATLRLSEFSAAGAKWMTEAAQKMVEAKTMPAYDTEAAGTAEEARKFRNDPDTAKLGPPAQAKLNAEHAEAVRLMNNLAQAYEQSYTQMNKEKPPTFPPPPSAFVPVDYYSGQDMARPTEGFNAGAGSAGSSYAPASSRSSASDEPGWVEGRQSTPDSVRPSMTGSVPAQPSMPITPDREVSVGLDSVTTFPNPTLPPTTAPPGGPLPLGPAAGGPNPHMIPPLTLPPNGGSTPYRPSGPSGNGLLPPVSGPGGPSGKAVGYTGPPPRDSGITGGRPVSPGGPATGIPRGTVIGGENTHVGGRGMGGGVMGGMGGVAGGPQSGSAGSAMGRRLATEPGGVVGGRQPFTQGGSGLVRNPGGTGPMGHAGAGVRTPGHRRESQGGGRPDYLAEDQETWQANRRVVPPVID
ncbi:hypothetical protein [Streptomyces sp. NPDC002990]